MPPAIAVVPSHVSDVEESRHSTTVTSGTRSVVIAGTGSVYANRVLADNPVMYLRYDEPADVFRLLDSTTIGSDCQPSIWYW